MNTDINRLLGQISSTEDKERMAGILNIEEAIYEGKANLNYEIIHVIDQIANTDPNELVRNEAHGLQKNEDFIIICKRLGITLPNIITKNQVYKKKKTIHFFFSMISMLLGVFFSFIGVIAMIVWLDRSALNWNELGALGILIAIPSLIIGVPLLIIGFSLTISICVGKSKQRD